MVMPRTNDAVVEAFSPEGGVRFVYSDVTGVARRLVAGHGVSPAAAPAFSRVLACTALMQVDFVDDDETLVVSADLGGRLGGFCVEYDGRGFMRGHPFETRPETLAPPHGGDPDDFFGFSARVKATRVRRGDSSVKSQMTMETPKDRPATPEAVFSELLSAAIPTRVCACASAWEGVPERVRALAVQRVPGGSEAVFKRLSGLVDDGTLAEQLSSDPTLDAMRDVLGLPDLFTGPTRALAFGCTCSEEKILASWAMLPREELVGMMRPLKPRFFRCHMCGRTFEFGPEKMLVALEAGKEARKRRKNGNGETEK